MNVKVLWAQHPDRVSTAACTACGDVPGARLDCENCLLIRRMDAHAALLVAGRRTA